MVRPLLWLLSSTVTLPCSSCHTTEGNVQVARQDRGHHRRQQPYRIGNGAAVCRGGRLGLHHRPTVNRPTEETSMQTLQTDYFAAYRNLKLSRDAKGVLVAEFHSDGGPFIMNTQAHTEQLFALEAIDHEARRAAPCELAC